MSVLPIKIDGRSHTLGRRIGKGGEGEVFAIDNQPESAVKIYKEDLRANREPKVRAMVVDALAGSTKLVAFPAAIATDARGGFIGFLMRLVSGYRPVHELYSPKSRKLHYPKADYRFLIRAALNIANAVVKVHQSGCVIGDFNHSGVLVSQDATVSLIDADSFQYSRQGTLFRCVVGVPDFTPPELHGADLSRIPRTQAHDNFGLAVAVFHLLAMGKHPYAGRFMGGDISMSEAIAQNRFAFSDLRAIETRTTPPPGAVRLKDFPPQIARAFEAAFGLDASARPGPTGWATLLKELEGALSHCMRIRTHYYPSAAGACLWCRVAGQSGVDMFPDLLGPAPQVAAGGPFDLERIAAQLRAIKLPEAGSLLPVWSGTTTGESAAVVAAKRGLLQRKLLGAGTIAAAIAGFIYLAAAAIVWLGLGIFGLVKFIGGSVDQAAFKKAWADADGRVRTLEHAFITRTGLTELHSVRDEVDRWIRSCRDLDAELTRELGRLKASREGRQREAFLDRFPIRRATIQGIGPAKTATLASYGIETTADVKAHAIMAVPGFGEAMTAKLMVWRKGHEAKFRYNPAPDGSDIQAENAARAAAAAKRADLQSKIRSGLAGLQNGPLQLAARAQAGDPALLQALGVRAQAEGDLKRLGIAVPASTPFAMPPRPSAAPSPTFAVSNINVGAASSTQSCPQCGHPCVVVPRERATGLGVPSGGAAAIPAAGVLATRETTVRFVPSRCRPPSRFRLP